ncbi:MAG: response regulator [Segetibacter sp.]
MPSTLFYQGHEGTFKGTGLGLALSKELIAIHQGKIILKSEKWKGTYFEVILPLGNAHLKKDEILGETPSFYINYDDVKIYTTYSETTNFSVEESSKVEKEYSILLIEDNTDMRVYLKNKLSKAYEIHESENGTEGLNLAYSIVPDLIITDIVLPGKDGLDITNILKNDFRTSHIPIIILTAKGSIEKQIESLKLMADAFIVKPFNFQYLEETINSSPAEQRNSERSLHV